MGSQAAPEPFTCPAGESCKAQMPLLLQAVLRVDKTSFLNNVTRAGTAEKAAESSVLWDHITAAHPHLAPEKAAAHRSYPSHKNMQQVPQVGTVRPKQDHTRVHLNNIKVKIPRLFGSQSSTAASFSIFLGCSSPSSATLPQCVPPTLPRDQNQGGIGFFFPLWAFKNATSVHRIIEFH